MISVLLGATAAGGVRLIDKLPLVTPWFLVAPVIPALVRYFLRWR